MDVNYQAIGQRIRNERMKKGYSQERLAALADLTPAHVSHIENGHTKLSLPALISIANTLDASADELLYDNIRVCYDAYDKDFKDLIDDCTVSEKEIILELAKHLKELLRSSRR